MEIIQQIENRIIELSGLKEEFAATNNFIENFETLYFRRIGILNDFTWPVFQKNFEGSILHDCIERRKKVLKTLSVLHGIKPVENDCVAVDGNIVRAPN